MNLITMSQGENCQHTHMKLTTGIEMLNAFPQAVFPNLCIPKHTNNVIYKVDYNCNAFRPFLWIRYRNTLNALLPWI